MACTDAQKERSRNWYAVKRQDPAWMAEKRERDIVYSARYRGLHREQVTERNRNLFIAMKTDGRYAASYMAYRLDPARRMRCLANAANRRALATGLEFDSEVRSRLVASPPTHCACCNMSLDYSPGRGVAGRGRSPSIDRVDNSRGYSVQNSRVICMRCNAVKSNATVDELQAVVAYMRRG